MHRGHVYQIPTDKIRLIGHHNYVDIAFVYAVCRMYDISDEAFSKALMTYNPLPHRLQYIGDACGIRFMMIQFLQSAIQRFRH